jgi:hypothetical protein
VSVFIRQSKKQEQDKANQEQDKANQEQDKANQEQDKANQEQDKAIQGNTRQIKRGDILPVIMLIFKSSHQFLCRSQYIRTNVSITLFSFYKV